VFGYLLTHCSARNNPPRFLIDGQTEIVLKLKEGPETPIGKDYHLFQKTCAIFKQHLISIRRHINSLIISWIHF